MSADDHDPCDLVERLLERGRCGTATDLSRATECSLAVLRYGHDCLSDDDRRWLDRVQ